MAKNLEGSFLLDFYGSLLGEKQRRLFDLYYNDDLSLAEIADLEGMTRQGVRDAVKRAETQLFDLEERLGLARRFRQVRTGLKEIRECVSKLEASSADSDPETKETIRRLREIVAELEEAEL